LAELDAQKKALLARQGKLERAQDTRRKILLGTLVLHHLETNQDKNDVQYVHNWIRRELTLILTRDHDKRLFSELLKPHFEAPEQSRTAFETASSERSDPEVMPPTQDL